MFISNTKCNYFISVFCSNANKLKKGELIYILNYIVDSLSCIGFNFKYLSLLGIEYKNLSSLPVKRLRYLFNYFRFQYLYYFLGFLK